MALLAAGVNRGEAAPVQHDILGLEVAVDDAQVVEVLQGQQHLGAGRGRTTNYYTG